MVGRLKDWLSRLYQGRVEKGCEDATESAVASTEPTEEDVLREMVSRLRELKADRELEMASKLRVHQSYVFRRLRWLDRSEPIGCIVDERNEEACSVEWTFGPVDLQ